MVVKFHSFTSTHTINSPTVIPTIIVCQIFSSDTLRMITLVKSMLSRANKINYFKESPINFKFLFRTIVSTNSTSHLKNMNITLVSNKWNKFSRSIPKTYATLSTSAVKFAKNRDNFLKNCIQILPILHMVMAK